MRVYIGVLLLILAILAGCTKPPPTDPGPTSSPPPRSTTPEYVKVFGGNGSGALAYGEPFVAHTGQEGPEPNIGITKSGAVFASALSKIVRSTDGGKTWKVVHQHTGDNSDPMMTVDVNTDRVYNAPMSVLLACSTIYWSDDDGKTWTEQGSFACGRGVYDHQKLAGGKPGPDVNPQAGVLHPSVLYMCYNAVSSTNCGVSYDGGTTWAWDRITAANAGASGCASGQNGHPTIGPDGTVAFARGWLCDKVYIYYSKDSGLTWNMVEAPAAGEVPSNNELTGSGPTYGINPEVAFTPDGTMYLSYHAPDQRQYLARTKDLGATWEGPWDVTPPGIKSTVFGALSAGANGRVAIAFLGTDTEGHSSSMDEEARWHLYIVTSDDAASAKPRFVSYRATPAKDPVQVGPIWQGGGGTPSRNLLDFIDAAGDPNGTFYVAFADGCIKSCVEKPSADASRSSELTVAALRGWSLKG